MGTVAGSRFFGQLPVADQAANGEWVKFDLLPNRPRYLVFLPDPVSLGAIPSSTPYQSFQRLINIPYEVTVSKHVAKRGYVRSQRDTVYLPNWVMMAASLEVEGVDTSVPVPDADFVLQVWKPIDQLVELYWFGMEYWPN